MFSILVVIYVRLARQEKKLQVRNQVVLTIAACVYYVSTVPMCHQSPLIKPCIQFPVLGFSDVFYHKPCVLRYLAVLEI